MIAHACTIDLRLAEAQRIPAQCSGTRLHIFRKYPAFTDRQHRLYFQALLNWVELVYWCFIKLYLLRFRVQHLNRDAVAAYGKHGLPSLFTAWHGDMYFCSCQVYRWGMHVMASRSNIGSVSSAMLWASGNTPVRGGSKKAGKLKSIKGGKEALEALIKHLLTGGSSAIIADAPRGPRHESKIGPVIAAARSGCPIIPIAISARRRWTLPGWDRGWLPKPFTPLAMAWGHPIFVPADADREQLEDIRVGLTESLLDLGRQADAAVGLAE